MGFHPASQIAVEEYLNGWRSPADASDGLMVKVVPVSATLHIKSSLKGDDSKGATCIVYLSRKNYLQLAEIYSFEVLPKLQNNSIGVHLLIKSLSIPKADKQIILGRLQQLVSDAQARIVSSSTKPRIETSPGVVRGQVTRISKETAGARSRKEVTTSFDSPQATRGEINPASELLSRVVRGSEIWRFSCMRTVLRLVELVMIRLSVTSGSKWLALQRKIPRKLLLTGAFASTSAE